MLSDGALAPLSSHADLPSLLHPPLTCSSVRSRTGERAPADQRRRRGLGGREAIAQPANKTWTSCSRTAATTAVMRAGKHFAQFTVAKVRPAQPPLTAPLPAGTLMQRVQVVQITLQCHHVSLKMYRTPLPPRVSTQGWDAMVGLVRPEWSVLLPPPLLFESRRLSFPVAGLDSPLLPRRRRLRRLAHPVGISTHYTATGAR